MPRSSGVYYVTEGIMKQHARFLYVVIHYVLFLLLILCTNIPGCESLSDGPNYLGFRAHDRHYRQADTTEQSSWPPDIGDICNTYVPTFHVLLPYIISLYVFLLFVLDMHFELIFYFLSYIRLVI